MTTGHDSATELAKALHLAHMFSNCIDVVGLIHPAHDGLHSEELLLSQLGIQQARLLIWGDILGITTPPVSTGITHAVPLHPGALNPEPDRPVYFGNRDSRLDDPRTRYSIEQALAGIVEPIAEWGRAKLTAVYGLQHFKGTQVQPIVDQPALDTFRLEAFGEKLALLTEVAASFPHLPKQHHKTKVPKQLWSIVDESKFATFLLLIRENVDYLIQLLDIQSKVDRSMKMDIRALGWHPSEDLNRSARDTWKLSLLREASEEEYPEYSDASQEALDNIFDQWKGSEGYAARSDHLNRRIAKTVLHPSSRDVSPDEEHQKGKKGLFAKRPKFLRMFSGKSGSGHGSGKAGGLAVPVSRPGPVRANSEWAPARLTSMSEDQTQRSHSIHGDVDLERTQTLEDLAKTHTLTSMISRHDQYRPST